MLVEGVRAVEAAVAAGAPLVDLVVVDEAPDAVRQLAVRAGVPVYVVPADELAQLSEVETSQGVLAVARAVRVPEERLTNFQRLLVLDGVQDPGNVGTILRAAAWFGAGGVLGGPGTAGFSNPKVVRAAMGAHWDVPLARTRDLDAALGRLRRAGFALYGADLAGVDAHAWQPRTPSALVLGSEAHGLSAAARQRVEACVAVRGAAAGRRGTESLNVAVAAGILVYEWLGGAVG